ncbi:hypothetical protein [Streptosporangium sp. NPDC049046]
MVVGGLAGGSVVVATSEPHAGTALGAIRELIDARHTVPAEPSGIT